MAVTGAEEILRDPALDVTKPNPARVYDYLLGGKTHFEADRGAAEKILTVVPHGRALARATRRFVIRAAELMAWEGVAQFIDLGTGIPSEPAVHQAARAIVPRARVLYVDADPVAVQHAVALLANGGGVSAIRGDIRYPEAIFSHAVTRDLIDFRRPVGLLFGSVLHFVSGADRAVAAFRDRAAAGSMLAISHVCSDHTPAAVRQAIEHVYADSPVPVAFRSRQEIAAFFGGLPLAAPGLVEVASWRANGPRAGWTLELLAGVASKPSR